MKTKLSILTCVAISGLAAISCGKINSANSANSSSPVSLLATNLQLPVPTNSYSSANPSTTTASTSMHSLFVAIDPIASPLKEANMHLAEVQSSGSLKAGTTLDYILAKYGAELSGAQSVDKSSITWTYLVNSVNYFTGTTSALGDSGNLVFPPSVLAPQIALHWQFTNTGGQVVKTFVLTNSNGNLSFVATYPNAGATNPTVTLTGAMSSGSGTINGKWDLQTGGSVTIASSSSGSAKYCWAVVQNPSGAQVVDTVCSN